ncbi:MAG: XRE family transcriptional regulator [Bdellovibrionaceae bacterium]|nr:XRE family transcriptional regulator [Pseudobdellovibrionaceae bacterium]
MKAKRNTPLTNSKEISEALGLSSPGDQSLVDLKAQISALATRAVKKSGLSLDDLVTVSGVPRSKVTAIRNGALAGISFEHFWRVLSATGSKVSFRLGKIPSRTKLNRGHE